MNKQEVMAKVALTEKDTGSPEVQVALLTAHINELNEHLKKNEEQQAAAARCSSKSSACAVKGTGVGFIAMMRWPLPFGR